ncbi:LOW QUALITY PROTEIN: hypothetical protein Cgig2_019274 [Carnegiea gigantea]|uniref:Uncharacterized protein n=1 Tax=Carnegiea gigantea TaxID=171969 RepID=A0A9Q1KL01_9CARY|nr:LOW QUALITY PROTEIN: hypothetical protein Cgig2_019274 [Carnegiea gigantea]
MPGERVVTGKRETKRGIREVWGRGKGMVLREGGGGHGDGVRIGAHWKPGRTCDIDQREAPCEVEDVVKQRWMTISAERGEGWYANAQIVSFLEVRGPGVKGSKVKAFSDTDEFQAYVEEHSMNIVRHPVCIGKWVLGSYGRTVYKRFKERTRSDTRRHCGQQKRALTLERVPTLAHKEELERMRALLMWMGAGDSVPEVMQHEGSTALRNSEGTVHAAEGERVGTSPALRMHKSMSPNSMRHGTCGGKGDGCIAQRQRTMAPTVECDHSQADVGDGGEKRARCACLVEHLKTLRRDKRKPSPAAAPLAKQVSPYVNPIAVCGGTGSAVCRMCTSPATVQMRARPQAKNKR